MFNDFDADKITDEEIKKYPKETKILGILLRDKKPLWYKNKDGVFTRAEYYSDANIYWDVAVRFRHGVLRVVIEVFDQEDILWQHEHLPVFNYFPTTLLLEEYGTFWRETEEE